MSTDITVYQKASLDEKRQYVQTIAAAGDLLPKGLWAQVKQPDGTMAYQPSPGKVMLVVETGIMLGLHPMAALQGIEIIEGKPTLKPALMSALIRAAGHKLRIKQTGSVRGGDLAVTTTLIRADDPDYPYEYTWSLKEQALQAGLIDSYTQCEDGSWELRARSEKTNKALPWEQYPARMLRWRSLSDAASAGAEDVLMGIHLTPEEMGADVDAEGAAIDLEPEPTEPSRPWEQEFDDAATTEDVKNLISQVREAGEMTDKLNAKALARYAALQRAEQVKAGADELRKAGLSEEQAETTAAEAVGQFDLGDGS